MSVPVLDMKPVYWSPTEGPRYRFSTSYPAGGVRVVGAVRATAEETAPDASAAIQGYIARDPHGNMGHMCGATAVEGGYRAVICLYHSNS
jgi:hypothetical protein